MKWLKNILGNHSASTAKDRLKIVIAQERSAQTQPDFLPLLHKEILAVIEKYMRVSSDMVQVDFSHQDQKNAVLTLNVTLPDGAAQNSGGKAKSKSKPSRVRAAA